VERSTCSASRSDRVLSMPAISLFQSKTNWEVVPACALPHSKQHGLASYEMNL
jgi:hypothetical protein